MEQPRVSRTRFSQICFEVIGDDYRVSTRKLRLLRRHVPHGDEDQVRRNLTTFFNEHGRAYRRDWRRAIEAAFPLPVEPTEIEAPPQQAPAATAQRQAHEEVNRDQPGGTASEEATQLFGLNHGPVNVATFTHHTGEDEEPVAQDVANAQAIPVFVMGNDARGPEGGLAFDEDEVIQVHVIPVDDSGGEEGTNGVVVVAQATAGIGGADQGDGDPDDDDQSDGDQVDDEQEGVPPGHYAYRGILDVRYRRSLLQALIDWAPSWASEDEMLQFRYTRVFQRRRRQGIMQSLVEWAPSWVPLSQLPEGSAIQREARRMRWNRRQ